MALGAVLRRANEHLYEVIVQGVEELALKAPFKLRVIEVSWVEIEIVRMHGHGFILELDDDLNAFPLGARREVQQRMLVQAKLGKNAVEARNVGSTHLAILAEKQS